MNFRLPDDEELDNAFCDICEEVTFTLLDPVPGEELIDSDGPYYQAALELSGVLQGEVLIAATQEGLLEMASNVLADGEDGADATTHGINFLKELANITAGVFAGLVTEEHGECDFSIPVASEITGDHWRTLCVDPWSRCYASMEGPLLWRCTLRDSGTGKIFHATASHDHGDR